jgi:hypothetical protein
MISKDKQYTTKDGQEVRIYATDGEGYWPIHGAIKTKEGWEQNCWKKDGGFNYTDNGSQLNLIEIVPKVKLWVEYYLDEAGIFGIETYYSEKDAADYANSDLERGFTCLKLDVFEYEPKPETK